MTEESDCLCVSVVQLSDIEIKKHEIITLLVS